MHTKRPTLPICVINIIKRSEYCCRRKSVGCLFISLTNCTGMVAAQLDLTTTSTMLSAFAARKKAVPSIQTDQNIISDSDSQLEEPSPLLQAPTKRKQNCNEDSVPPRKRKKRNQMSANSNYSRTISTSSVEPVGTRVSRGYSPSGPIEVEEESLGAT